MPAQILFLIYAAFHKRKSRFSKENVKSQHVWIAPNLFACSLLPDYVSIFPFNVGLCLFGFRTPISKNSWWCIFIRRKVSLPSAGAKVGLTEDLSFQDITITIIAIIIVIIIVNIIVIIILYISFISITMQNLEVVALKLAEL